MGQEIGTSILHFRNHPFHILSLEIERTFYVLVNDIQINTKCKLHSTSCVAFPDQINRL